MTECITENIGEESEGLGVCLFASKKTLAVLTQAAVPFEEDNGCPVCRFRP